MAEIGRGPLLFVGNTVRCGACDERLSGKAAGGDIIARHRGPVLVAVEVIIGGRAVHDCNGGKEGRERPQNGRQKAEATSDA